MPPSTVENPGIEWPPPRTASGRPSAPGEIDGADHVGHTGAAGDDRWMTIVGPVPDAALAVIILVAQLDGRTARACGELGEGGLPDRVRCGLGRSHDFLLVVVTSRKDARRPKSK
jgi:hypothetical protein